jgi:L-aspartate oxidase
MALGGVAAAVSAADTVRLHASDTMAVAAGLADPDVVLAVVGQAPSLIEHLGSLGLRFDRRADGELSLHREAGHTVPRILHAGGDATGVALMRALTHATQAHLGIETVPFVRALDLMLLDGRIAGVVAGDSEGRIVIHPTRSVVLATGGVGALYASTTNPPEATGDGLALAARAGARLSDLEFVQFHPTALAVQSTPRPLISEALRGGGATLVDEAGTRFMPALHPDAELAPRDVVTRAIWGIIQRGGRAFLDARSFGSSFEVRFPVAFAACMGFGVDPRVQLIPVEPAAHYHMGGVLADPDGQTSVPGLWACGEVACTRMHGANRLASNSLLEAMVVGARAGKAAREGGEAGADGDRVAVAHDGASFEGRGASRDQERLDAEQGGVSLERARVNQGSGRPDAGHRAVSVEGGGASREQDRLDGVHGRVRATDGVLDRVRELMTRHVGVVRDAEGLTAALTALRAMRTAPLPWHERDAVDVATLIADAALQRRESRGAHFRSDYPETDPTWARHSESAGRVAAEPT